ncbi:MAG: EamA family transporter [Gemmatimonadales bacterium]
MQSLSWIVLGVLAAAGGAAVAVFGKVGLSRMDALTATTARSLIMSLALLGVTAIAGRLDDLLRPSGSSIDARAWLFIVLAGLAGAASWLAYFGALRIGPAAQVAALDRLSLVLVVVFAAAFLGERPGWRTWAGVALVVLGVALVAIDAPPAPAHDAPAAEPNDG